MPAPTEFGTRLMKLNAKLLPPLALVGALALVPVTASSFAAADTTNYQELEKFMSVYERVKANYVDKVDDHTLIKGAIDGMLSALDPHSSYVEASDFDQLKTTTDGNYGGLGLSVSIEDGAVKVIAPTEDTPAWRAGIKAGDYITHINGELVYGLNLDEAVEKMRGQPGTPIKLTIVRPGRDKPFDVSMVRERIELHPVKWEIKDGIGYLNINTFSGNVGEQTTARYSTPSGRSVQAGGIEPDIVVPQLSDADYKDRKVVREADLRRHLLAQAKVEDKLLEADDTPDPRFTAKPDELEKKGIKDFQLYYALNTLKRLTSPAAIASAAPSKKSR